MTLEELQIGKKVWVLSGSGHHPSVHRGTVVHVWIERMILPARIAEIDLGHEIAVRALDEIYPTRQKAMQAAIQFLKERDLDAAKIVKHLLSRETR